MASFDYAGALNEGYTNDEINTQLGTSFDYARALKEGYNNEEIESFIKSSTQQQQTETNKPKVLDILKNKSPDVTTLPKASSTLDKLKEWSNTAKDRVIDIIPSQESLDAQRNIQGKEAQRTQQANIEARLKEGDAIPGVQPLGLESSFMDPTLGILGNKVAEGALKVFGKAYDVVQMPKHVRNIFASKTPEEIEEMKQTFDFMESQGIKLTDVLVEGSKGSNLAQFLTSANHFAVKEAFNSQQVVQTKYLEMVDNILGKFKAKKLDPSDISTWRDVKQAETIVAGEVDKLRAAYKSMEDEAYGKVSKLVEPMKEQYKINEFTSNLRKTLADEGVPHESANVVFNILNRMAKPYADETKQLALLGKKKSSLLVKAKQLKMEQKKALEANDIAKAEKLETQISNNSQLIKDNLNKVNDLKDVRYMTTKELLASVKLINRKLYKPGGSLSIKDADELRGLQIAKTKLNEYLEGILPEGELKTAIKEAKDLTIARAALFGAKDTGGEKLMLANLLNKGEYGQVTEYLTGRNAKENLLYIRDIFGKDSEAYQSGLSLYVNTKLGLTPDKINTILKTDRVAGISNSVDISEAAKLIGTLDKQDFSMLSEALGKTAASDIKSLQSVMQNFSTFEKAYNDLPRTNMNVLDTVSNGLKLVKDAITYTAANTAGKIIANQPKFRAVTGAAVGETIYLANTEDKDLSLEGALLSAIGGSVSGYYGGKAARSILEDDITKIARYLKSGKAVNFSKGMPKGLVESLTRYGQVAKQMEDEALKANPQSVNKFLRSN